MSRQIQFRRGTADEHAAFTGAIGEVTVDTTNKTLRVHDGETPGGIPLARADAEADLDGADYVTEWQNPTAENNYTWYRKYKSGWVEQGGQTTEKIITLPCPMSDINYNIQLTGTSSTSKNNVYIFGCKDITASGFTVLGNVVNNVSQTSGANDSLKHWRVSGICAII